MSKELIVITGASSGIGEATAKLFSDLGYPLLLVARRVDKLINLDLPNTICEKVDVTNREALQIAIKRGEQQFGRVGALINNAGVMLLGLMNEQDPNEWQKMFDVNVMGVMHGIHVVLPGMIARQGGTIINISSIAGRKTFPNHAAYCGSKFAVHAITENLREEVAAHNVRLITIAPGAVETDLVSHTTSNAIKSGYAQWKQQMGSILTVEDVARAIVFAFQQPPGVCIREIVLAATKQGA